MARLQSKRSPRGDGKRQDRQLLLIDAVQLWPTAEAANAKSGAQIRDGRRGLSLVTVSKLWPAVTAGCGQGHDYTRDRGIKGAERPTLSGTAKHWPGEDCLSSLLDLLTTVPGWTCSAESRRLSPRFVEHLQGWPIGWTDCGSAVTGFAHWLERARSALWLLNSASVELDAA